MSNSDRDIKATESISGSTPGVYQKLYRALALTAHEYQKNRLVPTV